MGPSFPVGTWIGLSTVAACNCCIVACRNYHELVDPSEAMPNEMPYYLRVESRRTGTYPHIAVDTWVVPCQHCPEPKCMLSCPEGAISRDAGTGVVLISKDTCTGCNAVPETVEVEKRKTSPCKVDCPAHIDGGTGRDCVAHYWIS